MRQNPKKLRPGAELAVRADVWHPRAVAPPDRADERVPFVGVVLRAVVSVLFVGLFLLGIVDCVLRDANYLDAPRNDRVQFVSSQAMSRGFHERCGPYAPGGRPVAISMLYSEDKRPWIEQAARRFARLCPNIQIELTPAEDGPSTYLPLLEGDAPPTLWAPADDLVGAVVDARWREDHAERLLDPAERLSLLRSPLVWLTWRDREDAIAALLRSDADAKVGPWAQLACATIDPDPDLGDLPREDMLPGTWLEWYLAVADPPQEPADGSDAAPVGQALADWGRVKFMHPHPGRSGVGLAALYLMAQDRVMAPSRRAAREGGALGEDEPLECPYAGPPALLPEAFGAELGAQREALTRWLRRCEAGVDDFTPSADALTHALFNLGPAQIDVAVTDEHAALELLRQLDSSDGAADQLRVIYPAATVITEHPVHVLRPDDAKLALEHQAARRWIGFLRSREAQEDAVLRGFRPATAEVAPERLERPGNPFLQMRRFGISPDAPTGVPLVAGEALRDLLDAWGEATGRY